MIDTEADTRRARPLAIAWNSSGIGRITIDGEFWAAVEWSERRQAWCIEDCRGECLTHKESIHGRSASKDAAVALATEMIRDGRMPSPQEAFERQLQAKKKRAQQPAQQRRRAERKQRADESARASMADWHARRREDAEQPLYEVLHDIFDFADPDLWRSNSFAALRPRLIVHVEAVIARLESERAYAAQKIAQGWDRDWHRRELADVMPRLAKAREILELLQR